MVALVLTCLPSMKRMRPSNLCFEGWSFMMIFLLSNAPSLYASVLPAPSWDFRMPYSTGSDRSLKYSRQKSLHRAGMALQEVMSRIRAKAYPLSVTTVREEDEKIILDGPGVEEKNLPQRLQPFPAIFEDRSELLEAVLMHLSSVEARQWQRRGRYQAISRMFRAAKSRGQQGIVST